MTAWVMTRAGKCIHDARRLMVHRRHSRAKQRLAFGGICYLLLGAFRLLLLQERAKVEPNTHTRKTPLITLPCWLVSLLTVSERFVVISVPLFPRCVCVCESTRRQRALLRLPPTEHSQPAPSSTTGARASVPAPFFFDRPAPTCRTFPCTEKE